MNSNNSKNNNKQLTPAIDFETIKNLISFKDIFADSTFTVIPWILLLLIIGIIIII
jgi:hypothetical protein